MFLTRKTNTLKNKKHIICLRLFNLGLQQWVMRHGREAGARPAMGSAQDQHPEHLKMRTTQQ